MSFLKLCLLLGVCWCVMTLMTTAGAPTFSAEQPNVGGPVPPPVQPTNGTTGTGSNIGKRVMDGTHACQEITSRLDPRDYFGATYVYYPRYSYSVNCAGTPSYPVSCGPANSPMRCLTRKGTVEFVQIDPIQCMRRRRVEIDVPVGCYCV